MKKPFSGTWPITQGFGENPEVYKRFGLDGHNGIDYGCPTGTPITAAAAGKVIKVGNDPQGYGLHLIIDHGDGYKSLYGHLQRVVTDVGFFVNQGQEIGNSDNTGFSTGPHLHFEVRLFDIAIDPARVLESPPPAPPAPILPLPGIPVPPAGELFRAKVKASALNVRSGPGLGYPVVKQLCCGDEVGVLGFDSPVVWVQIGEGQFCALRWQGEYYLGKV